MNDDDDVAMQTRCVYCLTEQYALSVIDISYGDAPCGTCGQYTRQMTKGEYYEALTAARTAAEHLRQTAGRRLRPPRQRRAPE